MLLECSKVGAVIDVRAIPRPPGVPLERWLASFPSFGFVFSVRPGHVDAVRSHFEAAGIACAAVGEVTAERRLWLRDGDARASMWDLAEETFITARDPQRREPAHA